MPFFLIPYSLVLRNNICLVSGPCLELGSLGRYIYFIQKFIDLPYPPINTTIILTTLFGNATSRSPGLSVCRSVGLLVCIVICHNFLKGGGTFHFHASSEHLFNLPLPLSLYFTFTHPLLSLVF